MDLFKKMYFKIQNKEFVSSGAYCMHFRKGVVGEEKYCLDCGTQNFKSRDPLWCRHTKIEKMAGQKFCAECGETLVGNLFADFAPYPEKTRREKVSARIKNFHKTFTKLFPDNEPEYKEIEMMHLLDEKFTVLTEKVGAFPNMKDVIYFILQKNERYEMSNEVKNFKGKRSGNLLEKLLEN